MGVESSKNEVGASDEEEQIIYSQCQCQPSSNSNDHLNEELLMDQKDENEVGSHTQGSKFSEDTDMNDAKLGATATNENTFRRLPKPFTESDHDWNTKFLLGNLENVSASARKLFSMGKLYLNREQKREKEDGYSSLFTTLPPSSNHAEQDIEQCSSINHEKHKEKSVQKTIVSHVQQITNLFVPMQNTAPLNCTQTYVQWRAAHDLFNMYSFCLPTRNIIYLQPIDVFPEFSETFVFHANGMNLTFFEMLQGFAQIFFSGMEVIIQPPVFVNDMEWNIRSRVHEATNQKQYCVTDLYPCLHKIMPRDGRCIVGITWTDLFPEGFNFVLGEASHVHKSAVISFGRFETTNFRADTHCDVVKMDGTLVWKLLKTISHEICHVFGFSHCSFFLCAMNESSSVSDALSQPLFLCPVCLRKLQRVCGFDILDRYRLLHKFLSHVDHQLGDSQHVKDSILWLNICIEYLSSTSD